MGGGFMPQSPPGSGCSALHSARLTWARTHDAGALGTSETHLTTSGAGRSAAACRLRGSSGPTRPGRWLWLAGSPTPAAHTLTGFLFRRRPFCPSRPSAAAPWPFPATLLMSGIGRRGAVSPSKTGTCVAVADWGPPRCPARQALCSRMRKPRLRTEREATRDAPRATLPMPGCDTG